MPPFPCGMTVARFVTRFPSRLMLKRSLCPLSLSLYLRKCQQVSLSILWLCCGALLALLRGSFGIPTVLLSVTLGGNLILL